MVLAAAPLDAATLVEDELLLTLPFAPRCERADLRATGGSVAVRADAGAGVGVRRARRAEGGDAKKAGKSTLSARRQGAPGSEPL